VRGFYCGLAVGLPIMLWMWTCAERVHAMSVLFFLLNSRTICGRNHNYQLYTS
jgi:hypothetical protein